MLKHAVGQVIAGRYRLDRAIAKGGMGIVYLATQMPLGRQVAIKLMLPTTGDKDFRRRFLLEASISAQLVQRHIVTVHDFGESEDGSLYMAMEYLDGESLSKTIKRELRLDSARTCNIAIQICRALRTAHAKGVVHRDLKPSNIMLLSDEEDDNRSDFVKVLDFGLGKVFESGLGGLMNADLTGQGALLGSPNYMAPEQVRCGPIDPRTDIYSLGVIIFHMLAGRPPFIAATGIEVMNHHLTAHAPPIAEIIGDVDDFAPELEVIVRRAMEKNPDDRYASMDELLSDLKAASRLIGSDVVHSGLPTEAGPSEIMALDDLIGLATPIVPPRLPTPVPHVPAASPPPTFFREAIGRSPTQLETIDVDIEPAPRAPLLRRRVLAFVGGFVAASAIAAAFVMINGRVKEAAPPVDPVNAAIAMPELQQLPPLIEEPAKKLDAPKRASKARRTEPAPEQTETEESPIDRSPPIEAAPAHEEPEPAQVTMPAPVEVKQPVQAIVVPDVQKARVEEPKPASKVAQPVIVPAKRLQKKAPEYPAQYRDRGIEGDVKVRVTIDPTGRATDVDVIERSPFTELNYAARKAALGDVFAPATKDGEAIEYKLVFVYHFRLK